MQRYRVLWLEFHNPSYADYVQICPVAAQYIVSSKSKDIFEHTSVPSFLCSHITTFWLKCGGVIGTAKGGTAPLFLPNDIKANKTDLSYNYRAMVPCSLRQASIFSVITVVTCCCYYVSWKPAPICY